MTGCPLRLTYINERCLLELYFQGCYFLKNLHFWLSLKLVCGQISRGKLGKEYGENFLQKMCTMHKPTSIACFWKKNSNGNYRLKMFEHYLLLLSGRCLLPHCLQFHFSNCLISLKRSTHVPNVTFCVCIFFYIKFLVACSIISSYCQLFRLTSFFFQKLCLIK